MECPLPSAKVNHCRARPTIKDMSGLETIGVNLIHYRGDGWGGKGSNLRMPQLAESWCSPAITVACLRSRALSALMIGHAQHGQVAARTNLIATTGLHFRHSTLFSEVRSAAKGT